MKRKSRLPVAVALVLLWLGLPAGLAFHYRYLLLGDVDEPRSNQLPLNRPVPTNVLWRGQEYSYAGFETKASLGVQRTWPLQAGSTAFAPGMIGYVGYVPKSGMTALKANGPTQYEVWLKKGAEYPMYVLETP